MAAYIKSCMYDPLTTTSTSALIEKKFHPKIATDDIILSRNENFFKKMFTGNS